MTCAIVRRHLFTAPERGCFFYWVRCGCCCVWCRLSSLPFRDSQICFPAVRLSCPRSLFFMAFLWDGGYLIIISSRRVAGALGHYIELMNVVIKQFDSIVSWLLSMRSPVASRLLSRWRRALTGVGVGNASRGDISLALADSWDSSNENGTCSI
jgi:hypothetical protein